MYREHFEAITIEYRADPGFIFDYATLAMGFMAWGCGGSHLCGQSDVEWSFTGASYNGAVPNVPNFPYTAGYRACAVTGLSSGTMLTQPAPFTFGTNDFNNPLHVDGHLDVDAATFSFAILLGIFATEAPAQAEGVPTPNALAMLALGLLGLGGARRRRPV